MAEFDPRQKAETWLFECIGKDAKNRPMYRRLPVNRVEYDGDPDCVMEPVSGMGAHTHDKNVLTPIPAVTEGYCIGFEIVNGWTESQRLAIGQNVGF